jgi:hypothetical protein
LGWVERGADARWGWDVRVRGMVRRADARWAMCGVWCGCAVGGAWSVMRVRMRGAAARCGSVVLVRGAGAGAGCRCGVRGVWCVVLVPGARGVVQMRYAGVGVAGVGCWSGGLT